MTQGKLLSHKRDRSFDSFVWFVGRTLLFGSEQ